MKLIINLKVYIDKSKNKYKLIKQMAREVIIRAYKKKGSERLFLLEIYFCNGIARFVLFRSRNLCIFKYIPKYRTAEISSWEGLGQSGRALVMVVMFFTYEIEQQ